MIIVSVRDIVALNKRIYFQELLQAKQHLLYNQGVVVLKILCLSVWQVIYIHTISFLSSFNRSIHILFLILYSHYFPYEQDNNNFICKFPISLLSFEPVPF